VLLRENTTGDYYICSSFFIILITKLQSDCGSLYWQGGTFRIKLLYMWHPLLLLYKLSFNH